MNVIDIDSVEVMNVARDSGSWKITFSSIRTLVVKV